MKAKRTTKKALAMLLALVMCLALLPVSVFADGGSGTMPAPDPTSGTVTYAGGSASSTDGNVTISKTAEKVYGTANTFKITLTVSTTDQVTPEAPTRPTWCWCWTAPTVWKTILPS